MCFILSTTPFDKSHKNANRLPAKKRLRRRKRAPEPRFYIRIYTCIGTRKSHGPSCANPPPRYTGTVIIAPPPAAVASTIPWFMSGHRGMNTPFSLLASRRRRSLSDLACSVPFSAARARITRRSYPCVRRRSGNHDGRSFLKNTRFCSKIK